MLFVGDLHLIAGQHSRVRGEGKEKEVSSNCCRMLFDLSRRWRKDYD